MKFSVITVCSSSSATVVDTSERWRDADGSTASSVPAALSVNDVHTRSSVSIVMPAFNAGATIGESIQSVIDQTHTDWELLVVDDGSTDVTRRVVESFLHDPRIRLLASVGRQGAARARNLGLDAARGDFVAFLDSDDLWLPDKLARQLTDLLDSGGLLSFTAYWRVAGDGRTQRSCVRVPRTVTYDQLLQTNCIGCSTALFDRRAFGSLRMPDVASASAGTWLARRLGSNIGHEDYGFWLAMLRPRDNDSGAVGHGIDEPLALYRLNAGSLSGNKLRAAGFQWLVYRQVEGLPLRRALPAFVRYALHGLAKHMRG